MKIDLTNGIGEFMDYKITRFPGGEWNFKLDPTCATSFEVVTRLNNSDDIILLCIVVDTLHKDLKHRQVKVRIPYFPYSQADRDFGIGECFSLKTICKILNSLNVDEYIIFDPHSDVTPALLKNVYVQSNLEFIRSVLNTPREGKDMHDWTIVSPDAGAYKKIFKLINDLQFRGDIITASKSRNHQTGELTLTVPKAKKKSLQDILIIDDICVGGRTFTALSDELKRNGYRGEHYLAISHGIFSNLFLSLSERFEKIFVTNSRNEDWDLALGLCILPKDFLKIYDII